MTASRKFSVASVTRDLQAVESAMNVMLEALEEIKTSAPDAWSRDTAIIALKKVWKLGTHSLREGVEQ